MVNEDSNTPLFELATYLVASAKDCLEEPLAYGPLRMLVAVDIIVDSMNRGIEPRDEFLIKMQGKIWDSVISVMNDRVAFAQALDSLLAQFAEELKNRVLRTEGV